LFPLLVRGLNRVRSHHEEPDLFLYDIVRKSGEEISYKAVQEREEVVVSANLHLPELFQEAAKLLSEDPQVNAVRNVKLRRRSLE
jgi:hypothetical protein